MKLLIFGLTISSSWGNGHATLWRGLCRALASRGHDVVFFERDVFYYAAHRDLTELPSGQLCLYGDWSAVIPVAERHLADADAAVVTSYCPDAIAATELAQASPVGLCVFYDLDAPVTIQSVRAGKRPRYIGPRGLAEFDLVLSYTGGAALDELRTQLGARRVVPLYGSVDPNQHSPAAAQPRYSADLSYLGTYAADRQTALEELFVEPARRLADKRFLIAGTQYPANFPWTDNIHFLRHLPPGEHPSFFCSSRLTLNVTRKAMAEMGFCPSGRLFEAAACGVPILSDCWEGLDMFFAPGEEIILAQSAGDTMDAMALSDEELARFGRRARDRALDEHTSDRRASELEAILADIGDPLPETRLSTTGLEWR